MPPVEDWLEGLAARGAALAPLFVESEDRHDLPRGLLARVAWQESRYRQDIISGAVQSRAGALGLMQIVPRWHPSLTEEQILDPATAIDYAGRYLRRLHRRFGTWPLALRAYNWGEGNVSRWLRRGADEAELPEETRRYSQEILGDLYEAAP